ncbi:hypothetical protein CQW23_06297 [Capsicum baccatum]|uniref:NB-ARC domain-containing protein n=1 Tax=Capsicum baccatum TaxID=33114 RepID=A0A2G2X2X5_CAPBA|nr:hypothetical protein CQW23_06297 [Capsicum baccatum]
MDLGTQVNFSTSFHPQTNGQDEHTIVTLEDMLRSCVIDFKGSRVDHYPLIEFTYNNSCHSSIQMAPFEELYGRRCRSPIGWFQVIIVKATVNTIDMAHASVASLMKTIEPLLTSNSPMQSLIRDLREEFCALHEEISSLEIFLKNFEKKIEKAQERLSDSLQQVAEDIDCIWKESTKIQDKGKQASRESTVQEFPRSSKDIQASRKSTVQEFPSSSKDILNVENNMVGRDDQRKWLVEHLTRSYSSEPKVIATVGMGGIGKTTLANEVYNDVCIRPHFDVCAWATVSQLLNVKEISLSLLRFTKGGTFDMNDEAELANMLQKSLKEKDI